MSSNPPTNLTGQDVSSQLGRKWLEATDNRIRSDKDATEPAASEQSLSGFESSHSENNTVFISIPDVGNSIDDALTKLDYSRLSDPDELATKSTKASELRLSAVMGMVAVKNSDSTPRESFRLSRASKEAGIAPTDPVRNDLAEPPTEWTDKPSTKDSPRKDTEKPTKQSSQNLAIDKLTNAIVERFPLGDPTVLLFVGSEANGHIDETCARVASALAKLNIGRILLLDSDADGHALSNASGVSGQPGITDVVNYQVSWESTIYGRSATEIDFLACGTGVFHHADSGERLRHAVAEMKREYQFICISGGDARSPSARIWNDICDGSYLLVSVKNSNQTIARSAVAEMQTSGARLLGCVVTDVE